MKTNILNLDNELENTEYVEGKPYVQYGIKYERNQALEMKLLKFMELHVKYVDLILKAKYMAI